MRPVDGALTLVGETLGALDRARPNAGDYDVFLVRLVASGQLLTTARWGTTEDAHPSAVAVDACGRAVVVGYTRGALVGTAYGRPDALVLTTQPMR